ncbi:OmpA family protein [Paracoccus sp. MC1854]|uniref:OmpA family protein n=1 Tax=Paracoccus sp. MC1854 TaxID=2760306 RepID=UPI0015FF3925|nr:OmpA family protein [Paracoccus sp. MC1854]MBB1491501.1 OmpA family protein [Paracoccus sp. MC1854]
MGEGTSKPRRARNWFLGLVLLASGAVAAYEAGRRAVPAFERHTLAQVQAALDQAGAGWAGAEADGLTLRLTGTAPDEVQRIRAVALATEAARFARIEDATQVPRPPETARPSFRFEVLRGEAGTSVIGLAPAAMDRDGLLARLERAAGTGGLTDLLETADHPAPEGWDEAVAFAVKAAGQMPRAKIAVTPGHVRIDAITDGEGEKARLEQSLAAAVPEGVTLVTDITAPRPLISPFALELVRTPEGTRLDRCAADTEPALGRILSAAAQAGADAAPCPLGLGAPSPDWADAAVAGIAALNALPQGRLAIRDLRVTLAAPHDVPPEGFAAARDRLAEALPPGFTLDATLAPPPDADNPPPGFVAVADGEGIRLRGTIADQGTGDALASLAGARFGAVDSGLTVRPDAPPGWTARVFAALEAMDAMEQGTATVTPDLIRLAGTTASPTAAPQIADLLAARLGSGAVYELSLIYDPRLDPAVDLPSGTDCVDALNATVQQSAIGFEPNRAVIAGDVAPVIEELAATMARCSGFRIEIGGHTDSQGADSFNRELSAQRAQAVLDAMAGGGIDTAQMVAVGYGETRPLGPNDTPAGREANRRIEFRLLSPEPLDRTPPSATITRGVTGGPAPAAEPPPPGAVVAGDGSSGDIAPAAGADDSPTPDEIAEAEGISIRPDRVTIENGRLTTPVPPPLFQSAEPDETALPDGIRRPRARPQE